MPADTQPAVTDLQNLVYMLIAAAIPVLIAYLERHRRDILDNTKKTESISHSLNGDLDARFEKLALSIEDAIAQSHMELDGRISRLEERMFRE